jgi:hypothetical protein
LIGKRLKVKLQKIKRLSQENKIYKKIKIYLNIFIKNILKLKINYNGN